MINAVEIHDSFVLNDEILSERVNQGRNDRTREFLVLRNHIVVGLLIYQRVDASYDFIYEIFVLHSFRGQGIGTWILSYAEQIATSLGRKKVRLEARSLYQEELNDVDLTSWYQRRGYIQSSERTGILEKSLPWFSLN